MQKFELVFTKEDFDIFLNHHRWDYIHKVYLLSSIEQSELLYCKESLH